MLGIQDLLSQPNNLDPAQKEPFELLKFKKFCFKVIQIQQSRI